MILGSPPCKYLGANCDSLFCIDKIIFCSSFNQKITNCQRRWDPPEGVTGAVAASTSTLRRRPLHLPADPEAAAAAASEVAASSGTSRQPNRLQRRRRWPFHRRLGPP